MTEKRGRPKGTVKCKVPTAVIDEWATVWNEGGKPEKALVLDRIEKLGLEKDVILARMAKAYYKQKTTPELLKLIEAEANKLMQTIQENIRKDKNFEKLSEILPLDNIVVNLETLEIMRVKRPVPRTKRR